SHRARHGILYLASCSHQRLRARIACASTSLVRCAAAQVTIDRSDFNEADGHSGGYSPERVSGTDPARLVRRLQCVRQRMHGSADGLTAEIRQCRTMPSMLRNDDHLQTTTCGTSRLSFSTVTNSPPRNTAGNGI